MRKVFIILSVLTLSSCKSKINRNVFEYQSTTSTDSTYNYVYSYNTNTSFTKDTLVIKHAKNKQIDISRNTKKNPDGFFRGCWNFVKRFLKV